MVEFSHILLCCLPALFLASAGAASEKPPGQSTGASTQDESIAREASTLDLIDFAETSTEWRTIDDVVMGGVSASQFHIVEGVAVFEGKLSLENNGGFASVRSQPKGRDLSESKGLLLRVRGDGKRYAFRLRTTSNFEGINYESRFGTVADEWVTIELPFEAFRPVFRGRLVPGADPIELSSVKTLGFLISDKQAGAFKLEIAWIKTYRSPPKGNRQ